MMRTGLIWSAALIGVMCIIAFWVYLEIAGMESVPIHWNARGEVDGWASPSGAMIVHWILIGTAVAMVAIFAGMLKIPSQRESLLEIPKLYIGIWLGTVALFPSISCVIAWVTVSAVAGEPAENPEGLIIALVKGVFGLCSALMMVLGNYLPKTRQNKVIGIRTKWTFANTENWERTHRFAGPVFMAAGFVSFVAALMMPIVIGTLVFTLAILAACIVSIWYSYSISKKV